MTTPDLTRRTSRSRFVSAYSPINRLNAQNHNARTHAHKSQQKHPKKSTTTAVICRSSFFFPSVFEIAHKRYIHFITISQVFLCYSVLFYKAQYINNIAISNGGICNIPYSVAVPSHPGSLSVWQDVFKERAADPTEALGRLWGQAAIGVKERPNGNDL